MKEHWKWEWEWEWEMDGGVAVQGGIGRMHGVVPMNPLFFLFWRGSQIIGNFNRDSETMTIHRETSSPCPGAGRSNLGTNSSI